MLTKAAGLPPDPAAVAAVFAPLAQASRMLLAVSGGPDSLALMILTVRWLATLRNPPQVSVATVDHRLREGSTAETAQVARWAAALGLAHETLEWRGPKPATAVQETARAARYKLLIAHAHALGASHVLTGHHRQDQAETVLMRLAGGSGIGGLGGMAALSERGGVILTRPLLGFSKSSLIAVCREAGLRPFDDPANANPRFARARMRAAAPELSAAGLTPERLVRLATRARRADEALARQADIAHARLSCGNGWADLTPLLAEPEEISLRVLGSVLDAAGGQPVRLERLEALHGRMRDALPAREELRATLAGLILRLDARGRLHLKREPQRRRGARHDTASTCKTASLGKAVGGPYIEAQDQANDVTMSGQASRAPSPQLSNGEHETVQE